MSSGVVRVEKRVWQLFVIAAELLLADGVFLGCKAVTMAGGLGCYR